MIMLLSNIAAPGKDDGEVSPPTYGPEYVVWAAPGGGLQVRRWYGSDGPYFTFDPDAIFTQQQQTAEESVPHSLYVL